MRWVPHGQNTENVRSLRLAVDASTDTIIPIHTTSYSSIYYSCDMSLRPTLARAVRTHAVAPTITRGIASSSPRRAGHDNHSNQEDDSTHTHECAFIPMDGSHEWNNYTVSRWLTHPSIHVTTMAKYFDSHHCLSPNLALPPFTSTRISFTFRLSRFILIIQNIRRSTIGHETTCEVYARE